MRSSACAQRLRALAQPRGIVSRPLSFAPRALLSSSSATERPRVAVAHGDGIGPEITSATLKVLEASGAPVAFDEIDIGLKVYQAGHESGIEPSSWDILRRNAVFLKAPITTPQGGGYKSLNVTVRKSMGLFANVRPVKSYSPFVPSVQDKIDAVIIRENEEDLYAGIEHQQTDEVVQCLKLMSRPGCERIARYAFEYARAYQRKRVTCMTKDNIMKMTDGMFRRVFEEIAKEYPDIKSEHRIIDIGAAEIAATPANFDVILTANLYGDIVSDILAQVAGSVGLCGSSNIGEHFAMFEAIHGSAPDIAGKNVANPSGMIQASCMMLRHLGLVDHAVAIENAWVCALEDGVHTGDIAGSDHTTSVVGTREFADAVISRLGSTPKRLPAARSAAEHVHVQANSRPTATAKPSPPKTKRLVGVDVFLHWPRGSKDGDSRSPDNLGTTLESVGITHGLKLKMITNRGVKVYPQGMPETFCTDHWRCRFVNTASSLVGNDRQEMARAEDVSFKDVLGLLDRISTTQGFDVIKIENLYEFDGTRAYSLGQGE